MKHYPLSPEVRKAQEFGADVTLHRIPCSCGWVGCWRGTLRFAVEACAHHVAKMQPSERAS